MQPAPLQVQRLDTFGGHRDSVFTLAASVGFAQYCDKIDQRDADAILGGPATPLGLGNLGCSYAVRGKTARLTLTLSDEGAGARKKFEEIRRTTKKSGWFVADELSLGTTAFSEWIRPGGATSGKAGFIVMKGSKMIQFYITDSGTLASTRQAVDKLRPVVKRVIDRI